MPTTIHLHRTSHTTAFSSHHKKPPQTTWRTTLPPPVSVVPDDAAHYHTHMVEPNQCTSSVVRLISVPIEAVWSVVRRFDKPDAYKSFLKSCRIIQGSGEVGTIREVHVVSGLPASWSTERLEMLDEERRVTSFSVIGGHHRLQNYRSVTSLHRRGCSETLVVESYVVDVPHGNTTEETCLFVDTIIGCNLHSLAQISEKSMKLR